MFKTKKQGKNPALQQEEERRDVKSIHTQVHPHLARNGCKTREI
jgi:hypothetical protein